MSTIITAQQLRSLVRKRQRQRIWDQISYTPHAGQLRGIHNPIDNGSKRIVSLAGRRSGKSIGWSTELTTELASEPIGMLPKRLSMIAGPEMDSTDTIFEQIWKWVVDEQVLGTAPLHKSSRSRYIEMPWRSRIEGKTTKDPTSLRGPGLVMVVADEYAFGKDILAEYLLPPLLDCDGVLGIPTTPNGYNHLRDLYLDWLQQASKGDTLYSATRWTSYDNPYNPQDSLDELHEMYRRCGDESRFRQEYLAEFEARTGAVYPQFDLEFHVGKVSHVKDVPVFLGVDWGFDNPCCVLFCQLVGSEQVQVFDEIYISGVIPTDIGKMVIERLRTYDVDINNDAQFKCAYCDPSGATPRGDWRKLNIRSRIKTSTGKQLNSIDDGIACVRSLLSRQDVPGLLIDKEHCPNLIKWLGAYHYSDAPTADDKPIKIDDHAPDALRYGVYGEIGAKGALDYLRNLIAG